MFYNNLPFKYSDRFSEDLIESLKDKNWKVRGEGLQKIIAILNEAKFITGNLGPLPEAIKGRLGDANKNLVRNILSAIVKLLKCSASLIFCLFVSSSLLTGSDV